MKRYQKIFAGTALALALAAATTVGAAPWGPMGGCGGGGPGAYGMGGPGGMGGMGMGFMGGPGMMWGGAAGSPAEAVVQRLAQVKTQLAITPQQEAAWQAFATQAGEQAAQMQAMHEQQRQAIGANTPAPERMNQHLALMNQRFVGMQALNTAMADLYAQLTPAQRATADGLLGHHMGPRGRNRGMGAGMGPGHGRGWGRGQPG